MKNADQKLDEFLAALKGEHDRLARQWDENLPKLAYEQEKSPKEIQVIEIQQSYWRGRIQGLENLQTAVELLREAISESRKD